MLDKADAALLIIDIQERLAAAMEQKNQVVKNTRHLVELAKMLRLPVLMTEQYPKGLGPTVPEIREALPAAAAPIEKLSFNCCGEPKFLAELKGLGRNTIIVTGMETHICVLQTTLGLIQSGFTPHVMSDAVCSRAERNWTAGLELMRDAGAVVSCTETALFQLLGAAGTEEFKAVSRLIK
jgi:nicotinamidase-related amidase